MVTIVDEFTRDGSARKMNPKVHDRDTSGLASAEWTYRPHSPTDQATGVSSPKATKDVHIWARKAQCAAASFTTLCEDPIVIAWFQKLITSPVIPRSVTNRWRR